MCWNTYFIVLFEHQPKIAKRNGPKRNDELLTFCKTQVHKKNVLLQPPFWPKNSVLFFKLFVLKSKTLMLNKKTYLKIRKSERKEKGIWRKKQDRKPKRKQKRLMKIKYAIEYFDVVPFMKQKQRRKENEQKDKSKKQKESRKERQ